MNLSKKFSKDGIFYGWWVLVLCSITWIVGMGIFYHSFTVFFLPLKRDFMVSSTAIAMLYGLTRLEGGAEGVIVGPLIDKFGPRTMIIAGASLAGIGLILLSTVHSYLAFILVYILIVSFGYNAGFYHPISTAINSWFIKYRGTGLAIINAAGSLGGVVMAPLLSHLISTYSWRMAYIICAIMIMLIAIPAALRIRRSPESMGLRPDGRPPEEKILSNSSGATPKALEGDFTVKEALKTKHYWLLTLSISLRLSITVALNAFVVPILVWKGLNETNAAYLVSLGAFVLIFSTMAIGWIGDRWSKPYLSAICILPLSVILIIMVYIKAPLLLYALPIGLNIAVGTAPINWAMIGDFFGRRVYATLRGIMGVAYGTGTFLAPIYAGWIYDHKGSYDIVLITFAVVLVISACVFIILRPPTQKREATSIRI